MHMSRFPTLLSILGLQKNQKHEVFKQQMSRTQGTIGLVQTYCKKSDEMCIRRFKTMTVALRWHLAWKFPHSKIDHAIEDLGAANSWTYPKSSPTNGLIMSTWSLSWLTNTANWVHSRSNFSICKASFPHIIFQIVFFHTGLSWHLQIKHTCAATEVYIRKPARQWWSNISSIPDLPFGYLT